MARETSITSDEFSRKANELQASGSKVTARSMRLKLGGGSMTTITRLLREWEIGQPTQPVAEFELPGHLQVAVKTALMRSIEDAEAPLRSQISELQQSNNDLLIESERRIVELNEAELRITELESIRSDLTARLDETKRLLAENESKHAESIGILREELKREVKAREIANTELKVSQAKLETMSRFETEAMSLKDELRLALERANSAERSQAGSEASLRAALDDQARDRKALDDLREEIKKQGMLLMEAKLAEQTAKFSLDASKRELDLCKGMLRPVVPEGLATPPIG